MKTNINFTKEVCAENAQALFNRWQQLKTLNKMNNQKKFNRRKWLKLGAGGTIGIISLNLLGCKENTDLEKCVPTQYDTMGPFHPKKRPSG